MPKSTNENKKLLEKKLDYIGLDLAKIPKFLSNFEPLNYNPIQAYDEKEYKIYKHINVQDIQILITPTNRLADLKEKYKLASPLFTYLDEKNEENVEKFATFIKMLTNLKLDKLEKLEEEQEKLKENLPTKIKYKNNFIWQIYYSEYAQKYFMLVPSNEQDTSAMFYLLKKQISSKKSRRKETIFVPINYLEYSGDILNKSEIIDLENYLWYFTKDWVSLYEVYNEKNKMSLKIVGNLSVYEKIKSDYVITLTNRDEAIEFYKLLKAMFILATGLHSEYEFVGKISDDGSLQFVHKNKVMNYKDLPEFIKSEYIEKIDKLKNEIKQKSMLEKKAKKYERQIEELTQEYLVRQKQIATFLECKKTFFGKVKYFFKKKKENDVIKKVEKSEEKEETIKEEYLQGLYKEKEQYTIEDLIEICTQLEERVKQKNNINLDIDAMERKKDILSKKIENAELYIREIDNHKKSIFEFWKFTSKDEVQTLNEAEKQEEIKKEKIAKYFDYETDLEDLGKIVDKLQRRKLSKSETDSIFIAKEVINSIKEAYSNKVENKESIKAIEKELQKLKKEYKANANNINIKDFDIFGGMSEDKTKIKMINNEKHREIEKDKYKLLNISLDTDVDMYQDVINNYLNLILEAFQKIKSPYDMSIYKVNTKKEIEGIEVFDINPQNALEPALNNKKENITLCRINVKENMPLIYYSNIMFFDNTNKTLPLGMNLSSEVLVDIDKMKINNIKEETFNVNCQINEFETSVKKVKVYEYDAE